MKRRVKKHPIPIYHGELIIIQDKDCEWVAKKYNLEGNVKMFGAITFPHHTKQGYSRYVMAFFGKTSAMNIAHEAVHFVNNVFNDRYINLDLHNDEPQAYLMGWVVNKCHRFLKIRH